MTLSDLGSYLSDIEESIVTIRESDIESELDELDTSLAIAIEAIGENGLGKQLVELQAAVKNLITGFAKMNSTNLEEVAE